MKSTITWFLAFVMGLWSPQLAMAQQANGLPLERHYSAGEGITWLFTNPVNVASDVNFFAAYQRGYKNQPVVGLKVVRFTLSTPKATPIWDKLKSGDCFISYSGKRQIVISEHHRTGDNDSEDMVDLKVPVQAFREMVAAGKFFVVVNNTSYPVYGPALIGLRALVSSMNAKSSQAIAQQQAAASKPKPVKLTKRSRRAAQNCVRVLRRLESAISGGANYYEYSRFIVEAQFTIDENLYIVPEGPLKQELSRSFTAHKAARRVWSSVSGEAGDEIVEALRNRMMREAVSSRMKAQTLLK
jgi:hypothetical protein